MSNGIIYSAFPLVARLLARDGGLALAASHCDTIGWWQFAEPSDRHLRQLNTALVVFFSAFIKIKDTIPFVAIVICFSFLLF